MRNSGFSVQRSALSVGWTRGANAKPWTAVAKLPLSRYVLSATAADRMHSMEKSWHHAPVHRLSSAGAFIITASTYQKTHIFCDRSRLDMLQGTMLRLACQHEWNLQAWAIFSNHYHLIGISQNPAKNEQFLKTLHSETAGDVNRSDAAEGRRVWFQFWDTQLTYEASYYARLKYVHENPARHGLVKDPTNYPWCSARWFSEQAKSSFRRRVESYRTDKVSIEDDFDPLPLSELA